MDRLGIDYQIILVMVLRSRAYAMKYGIFRCGRLKTSAQVNFADSIII